MQQVCCINFKKDFQTLKVNYMILIIDNNIPKYLNKAGITQEEFARQLDVTRQTVHNYMNNKISKYDYQIVYSMAKILKVEINELFNFKKN